MPKWEGVFAQPFGAALLPFLDVGGEVLVCPDREIGAARVDDIGHTLEEDGEAFRAAGDVGHELSRSHGESCDDEHREDSEQDDLAVEEDDAKAAEARPEFDQVINQQAAEQGGADAD